MLGVYLHSLGLIQATDGLARFSGRQGRHVGRPGTVDVAVELDGSGQPATASIAGHAVIAAEARLRLA